MKFFTQKSFIRKFIISIICVVLLNFCMAPSVQAASFGGKMMKYIRQFATALTDVAASTIQLGLTGHWLYAVDGKGSGVPDTSAPKGDYWIGTGNFQYPVLQISPELIFANKIQILDVNFISEVKDSSEYVVGLDDNGPLQTLRTIIATWYVTLRTIAVVGLLSVLIYIGIRIIISSTSEKAKYKEKLLDWIIAFCLLFFMHYIMAATITIVEKVNDMLGEASGVSEGIEIPSDYGTVDYVGNSAGGSTSVGSSITTPGFGITITGSTDEDAINEAKSQAASKGATVQSESSGWKQLSSSGGFTKSTIRSEYIIECDICTIRIIKTVTIYPSYTPGVGSTQTTTYSATTKAKPTSGGNSNISTGSSGTSGVDLVSGESDKVLYFTNYARLFLNVKDNDEYIAMSVAYLLIYIALVTFTVVFTFRYIKRVIYIAFLTMIAPVVALTYPLDKLKDRKSTSMEYVV